MTRRKAKYGLVLFGVAVLGLAVTAKANPYRVTQPTDFWFTFDEPTMFTAYTTNIDGMWTDPMLWFYDEAGDLVAWNDDYYSLMSRLDVQVGAGSYRLRAGVCCGNPDAWRTGWEYNLTASVASWDTTTTVTTTGGMTTIPVSTVTTTTDVPPTDAPSETSSTTTTPLTTTTQTVVSSSSSLPTWFSTTTQPRQEPTTTLTSPEPLTTEPSSTPTVIPSSPTVSSFPSSTPSLNSVPSTTFPTTTSFRPVTTSLESPTISTVSGSLSTIPSNSVVSVPERSESTVGTLTAPLSENAPEKRRTFSRRVGIGPFSVTLTVTEAQRTTVVAAAIVQITTVATITTPGGTNNSTHRRRR